MPSYSYLGSNAVSIGRFSHTSSLNEPPEADISDLLLANNNVASDSLGHSWKFAIDAESQHWRSFLARLRAAPELRLQNDALLRVWEEAKKRRPDIPRPAAFFSETNTLHISWAFQALPGVAFAVDISADGGCEWYFRDDAKAICTGTEDEPTLRLPDAAFDLLASIKFPR